MAETSEIMAPAAGVERHLHPWEVITWTNDQLSAMYSDWGIYFARKQKLKTGTKYYDAALKISPNNTKVLLNRSQIKRKQAHAPEALINCGQANRILKKNNPNAFNADINLEICDALFETNAFEKTKQCLHFNLRHTSHSQTKPVLNRLRVVNRCIHEALSDETAPAVYGLISKLTSEQAKQRTYVKPDCDVLSLLEEEEVFLSPLERKRRERQFKIYNQTYLHGSWMDVTFIKKLRENPNLLIKQYPISMEYLKKLTDDNYKTIRVFTKMLHARCPLYSNHIKKYPNKELYLKYQQENFYHIQYQTRRNMFKILRTIRALIRSRNHKKLTSFVDEVLGEYVTIKTDRIMPWKVEFINEVCNYLGLARISEFKVPSNIKTLTGRNRLHTLLNMPTKFGNQANVKQRDIMLIKREQLFDPKAELFKRRIARFETRMRFAKHPIERSYLYHEAAVANLENNSFDACCLLAHNAMDEALKCNNYVWAVLSALIACKAHVVVGKIEKQREMLIHAFKLAKQVKNIDLILFVDICIKVNKEEMGAKRLMVTSDGSTKRRVTRSMSSLDVSDESSPARNSRVSSYDEAFLKKTD